MSPRRRILHLISGPGGMGGAERIAVALAGAAEKYSWEALVLNPFDLDPMNSQVSRALMPTPYAAASFRIRDIIKAARWCRTQVQEFRPDLLHVQMAHAGLIGATLPSRATKILSHQHGAYFDANNMRLRRAVDRWATRRFDHVVAVSDHVFNFLLTRYELESSRLHVIANGWEGEPLAPDRPARPVVLAVGNLRPEKGHSVLISAFSSVVRKFPDAHLVIVGDGPLRSDLEAQAAGALPAGSFRFEGRVDNVWPYLARAHVAAVPSFAETSGIAAMEAMAAGLPVVASDVGGLPELVQPERTGLLVAAGDPAALAAALERVLSDPKTAVRLGEEGRNVVQRFTIENMLDDYFGLYERLYAQRREDAPD